ncbi:ATP-binding protein [Rhodocytophaga aerolata]|uniref:histidine kinase n=1 Tax=Rhodocytophaga aerolata TaxID=455078 RepID=A0ABT8R1Y6_9BACT|nr:ATP-binding protein [Rhodocytophaga aerolata]MDO1446107.1 ATP-binding protein [Rhodocytophaga aerolata]
MSLRLKFILYWVSIHVIFAGLMVYLLRNNRLWLLAVEVLLVISFGVAMYLLKSFFKPLDMVMKGIDLIKDSNFSTAFHHTGQAEVDSIVNIYNRMLTNLQYERQRMQEKHFFLEKIIGAAPFGIVTLDFDENIALINPYAERLLEKPLAQLTGKPIQAASNLLSQALATLEAGRSEVITLPSRRKIRCTKSDFYDQGFQRYFYLMEELTEELRLSEKQAYEKLIRILSHEVNNSIGAANSLLQSCLTYKTQLQPADQEDFEMAIGVVTSRTAHLNDFMRSYVNVIRLADPKRQLCNIRDMLENIALLFKADLAHRKIQLMWHVEEDVLPVVYMDRDQMEQVFTNIIKNAMEAIGQDGVITIRLVMQEKKLILSIEDTGEGIPAEVKANLFTPFFSTKENGQGIGLTLIQEILTRHGFIFSLDSTAGEHTAFRIIF